MRKTVRIVLPCPYCGQKIRFNECNPAYLIKTNPDEWRRRLKKKLKQIKVYICPYKNCRKVFHAIVTPRKIRLSKRVSKGERMIAKLFN